MARVVFAAAIAENPGSRFKPTLVVGCLCACAPALYCSDAQKHGASANRFGMEARSAIISLIDPQIAG